MRDQTAESILAGPCPALPFAEYEHPARWQLRGQPLEDDPANAGHPAGGAYQRFCQSPFPLLLLDRTTETPADRSEALQLRVFAYLQAAWVCSIIWHVLGAGS